MTTEKVLYIEVIPQDEYNSVLKLTTNNNQLLIKTNNDIVFNVTVAHFENDLYIRRATTGVSLVRKKACPNPTIVKIERDCIYSPNDVACT